jgi:hypothetical protein
MIMRQNSIFAIDQFSKFDSNNTIGSPFVAAPDLKYFALSNQILFCPILVLKESLRPVLWFDCSFSQGTSSNGN